MEIFKIANCERLPKGITVFTRNNSRGCSCSYPFYPIVSHYMSHSIPSTLYVETYWDWCFWDCPTFSVITWLGSSMVKRCFWRPEMSRRVQDLVLQNPDSNYCMIIIIHNMGVPEWVDSLSWKIAIRGTRISGNLHLEKDNNTPCLINQQGCLAATAKLLNHALIFGLGELLICRNSVVMSKNDRTIKSFQW